MRGRDLWRRALTAARRGSCAKRRAAAVLLLSLAALLACLPQSASAETAVVTAVDIMKASDGEQVIRFEFTTAPAARLILLKHPDRIALDFSDAIPAVEPNGTDAATLIETLRHGATGPERYRYLLTPSRPVEASLVDVGAPAGRPTYELRLSESGADTAIVGANAISPNVTEANARATGVTAGEATGEGHHFTIVIDPGHGGVDNGAIGENGVKEKDINLAAAKSLRDSLETVSSIRVVLTREDDRFIALGERTAFAQKKDADLFISLHADSIRYHGLRGATIYTLSNRASDALSREIVENENAADQYGAPDLAAEAPEVFDILLDLTRRETVGYSEHFATALLEDFRKAGIRLINNPKRSAGFRVLKAPDVPSVLVEMGFLSNEKDAELLMSEAWREKTMGTLAHSIISFYRLDKTAEAREAGGEDADRRQLSAATVSDE
ncbi:N-acetylmuramoyl-L-alanine amidase [Fulvimarina manganoxydans]|uniref:N-acetylmuramoyl-L-alanine amidase n=2 Tax=Fulvimarina manganoxydans TaxID=937218 RepID=A0A1W1ZYT0_9HYPH|nr:N-acetylmuramoyl-L-alanine amidase [Fulvimarina manganoxydans]